MIYILLEPIPKFDRNIANSYFNQTVPCCCNHNKNKNKAAITKISDELWDRISTLLPTEKPNNTVGLPAIPYRKVFNGIVYVIRTKGCHSSGRCYLQNMAQAQPATAIPAVG